MSEMMAEEYKAEFPGDDDPNTKAAFGQGFRSFRSDSLDYLLEHHDLYPLSLVIFYDGKESSESIMRYASVKLLEQYVVKKQKYLEKGGDLRQLSNKPSTKAFEAALPSIMENILIEYIKSAFIDFAAQSLMVPWIYLCFHNVHPMVQPQPPGKVGQDQTVATGLGESAIDKSKKQSHSLNSSRVGVGYHMGVGTSLNKSGLGAQSGIDPGQYNSALHESNLDIEMEFGY